jgi:hypothetical protein
MSAVRREPAPITTSLDARIVALIEAAYGTEAEVRPYELGRLAYRLFQHDRTPAALEWIISRALSRVPEEQFPNARAFGDALVREFGPYLILYAPGEELIFLGSVPSGIPFPAVLAVDGVHAIDLLIENPNRRLVMPICQEAANLLDSLRDCILRKVPILVDHESARFPHPGFVKHPGIKDRDLEMLRALCPPS